MPLIISAITQGLFWSLLSLGLFISFRILNIADMTTEGSYPLGAAFSVMLIHAGINPLISIIISIFIGMISGLFTAILITKIKIPSLLSGILTMSALFSINLHIMKRPNLSLINKSTIFEYFKLYQFSDMFIGLIFASILIIFMYIFFQTELGLSIIATGDNEKMAKSFGISTNNMIILGLMLSNGIAALSGAVLAQYNGYADVNSGLGVIVIALVGIIIGEVVFGKASFLNRLIYTVFGSIIYRILLVIVLKFNIVSPNDFKLISAIIIAFLLYLPQIKKYFNGGKINVY